MPRQVSWALAAALVLALGGPVSAQQTPPDPGAAANVRQMLVRIRRQIKRCVEMRVRLQGGTA